MLTQRHLPHAGARLLAIVLAAAAIAICSVLVPAPPPASADIPPGVQPLLNDAVSRAKFALQQRPECDALLSSPQGSFPASVRGVLDTAKFDFQVPPPESAAAAASVAGDAFGPNSLIRIHPKFVALGDAVTQPFSGQPEIDATHNGDLQRALAILHEVGHLTGAEGQHVEVTDDLGIVTVPANVESGLYNTRILNTCFATGGLITGGLSCRKYFEGTSYAGRDILDCIAFCSTSGPMTVAWTSDLPPEVVTDIAAIVDEGTCYTTRRSGCPIYGVPSTVFTVTLRVTDSTGRSSADSFVLDCYTPQIIIW